MRYQPYSEYKHCDLEYLPKVPTHWNVMQLKRTVEGCNNGIWGTEPDSERDNTIIIRVADFNRKTMSVNDRNFTYRYVDDKEKLPRLLNKGDLLIEKSGGGENTLVGQVVLFDKDFAAVTSNFVAKMTPHKGFCSSYLNYTFAKLYADKINYCSIKQNTGIQNLDTGSYLGEKFGFPLLAEQKTIASFLDHETAKIDDLITKQERLIELLNEKRQAVISHAVTKGLNPDVPMKDSGVEWLGEVPEHWKVKQYRHSTEIYRGKFGHRPRNDPSLYDGDYPFIQTGDVAQADKFIFDYKQTLNEKGAAVSARFPKGTLVMAIAANIGDTAILTFDAHCPDSIVGFRPSFSVSVEFLRYSLIASIQALQATATQSTQANLNIDRISAVKSAFPPQEEQVKIIEMLDSLLARYDVINEKAVEMISLMKERRTALISSAVTGKIDVRNWQPNTH